MKRKMICVQISSKCLMELYIFCFASNIFQDSHILEKVAHKKICLFETVISVNIAVKF